MRTKWFWMFLCFMLAACSMRPGTEKSSACEREAQSVADQRYHWRAQEFQWLSAEDAAYTACMKR